MVVDTTAQEKNITYPTDGKLYYKMLNKLVNHAKCHGINLRQSYVRVSKRALLLSCRYFHTRKTRLGKKEVKKLKTYLGRTYRDIKRKSPVISRALNDLLQLCERLLAQQKSDKNKLYSLHHREVICFSKGKKHKPYEYGNKSGFVTTAKECFIVGALAFTGSPYDGHTLAKSLRQTESLLGRPLKHVSVDLGYRGHDYKGQAEIHVIRRERYKRKSMQKSKKRRPSIEPVIGHKKNH